MRKRIVVDMKKVVKRIKEEFVSTYKISKVLSITEGMKTLRAKVDIQVMNHNGYQETEKIKRRLLKKHHIMMKYFEYIYKDYIANYDFDKVRQNIDAKYCDYVWVCWWQGEEQAPAIVKRCIASIRKSFSNHKVILITEENYNQFVTFPDWIEEKRKKGIISRTHFSDLLRLELLTKYGGIWVDSTFYCINENVNSYFSCPLWSIKRPDYFHASIASGYFANYSLGCNADNKWVYAVIRDFTMHYWKMSDMMIDYLFLDYIIVLVQRHNKSIRKIFAGIKPNNPMCDELFKVLGEPFDENLWNRISKDTAMFKLTWKQQYPKMKNGKETFYGKIINNTL